MITKQKLIDEEEDRRSTDSAASTVVEQEKDEVDASRRNDAPLTLPPPVTANNDQQPISQQSVPTPRTGRAYAALKRQWSRRWFKIIIIGVALAILIVVICTSVILLTRRHPPPPRPDSNTNLPSSNSTSPNNGTTPYDEDEACYQSMQNSSQFINSMSSQAWVPITESSQIIITSEADWIDGSFTIKPADIGKQQKALVLWTISWTRPDLKTAFKVVTNSTTGAPTTIVLTSNTSSDDIPYNTSECKTLVRADVTVLLPWASQTGILPWTQIKSNSMLPHTFPITMGDLGNAGTVFDRLDVATIAGDIVVEKVTVNGHTTVTAKDGNIVADFVILDGTGPFVSSENGNVSLNDSTDHEPTT